jgi:hypothetical protein
MAIQTTLEQLEEVQASISETLKGQSISAGDKRVDRPDLAALYKAQAILRTQYNAEQSSGGMFNKVRFDAPR